MADSKNNVEPAAWEVVSVTESMYSAAPSLAGSEMLDEAKDKEAPSDAMFMSGHFSVSQKTELESLLMGSDSKSSTEDESFHQAMVSIVVPDKTKNELDVDFVEPKLYASSEYGPSHVEEVAKDAKDKSVYNAEKGMIERKNSGCNEEKAIEESKEDGEESWWLKKLGLICHKVSEDKMLCVFVATAALVGVAILSRRWQREKLQFSLSSEGTNSTMVAPLNRIKVLLTNNQQHPLMHAESSTFSQ